MRQANETAVWILRFIALMKRRITDFAIDSGRQSVHACTHCVEVECHSPEATTGLFLSGYAEVSIASGVFVLWAVDICFDGLRWEVETEVSRNGTDAVLEILSETTEQLEDLTALFDRAMRLWTEVGGIDEILGGV